MEPPTTTPSNPCSLLRSSSALHGFSMRDLPTELPSLGFCSQLPSLALTRQSFSLSCAYVRADRQCKGLKKELKKKLKPYVRNSTRQAKAREKVLKLTIASLDGVAKSSMSRAVQQSTFWHFPGKVLLCLSALSSLCLSALSSMSMCLSALSTRLHTLAPLPHTIVGGESGRAPGAPALRALRHHPKRPQDRERCKVGQVVDTRAAPRASGGRAEET